MDENSQIQSRSGKPMPHFYPSERTSSKRRTAALPTQIRDSYPTFTGSSLSENYPYTPNTISNMPTPPAPTFTTHHPRYLTPIDQNISPPRDQNSKRNTSFHILQSFAESVQDEDFLPGAHPNCEVSPRKAMASQLQQLRSSETTAVEEQLLIEVSSEGDEEEMEEEGGSVRVSATPRRVGYSMTNVDGQEGGRDAVMCRTDRDRKSVVGATAQTELGKCQEQPGAIFELHLRIGADPEFSLRIGSGKFECLSLLALAGLVFVFGILQLKRVV